MMTGYGARSLVIAVLGLWAAPASAQTVSDVLDFLVTGHSVQTGSVARDTAAAAATSLTVSRALLANLATLPVPTSIGGFVYKFHPELGTVQRATSSFGPFFVERALAPGHGAASIGLTLQHWQFTSLDGRNLRDGTLETTANQFVDELEPFDVDRLRLAIDASIATVHGSVGVGSRTEISAALPFIVLRLNGSRVNAYRGQVFTQAEASATATGLADVVVRTKYTMLEDGGAGVAAAVEARLPTGRQEDLLGSGAMSWKVSAIGSLEGARLSSHANVGFGFGGLARDVTLAGALAASATDRLTLTGEVVGRWMNVPGGITTAAAVHPSLRDVRTLRLVPDGSTLAAISVAPGVKWNVSDTWVLVANTAIPLSRGGLTARLTPFIGFDYTSVNR
jgi:Putative MetA-pathway of phenol degradation